MWSLNPRLAVSLPVHAALLDAKHCNAHQETGAV